MWSLGRDEITVPIFSRAGISKEASLQSWSYLAGVAQLLCWQDSAFGWFRGGVEGTGHVTAQYVWPMCWALSLVVRMCSNAAESLSRGACF